MAKVRLIEGTPPTHARVYKRWTLPAGHSVRSFVMRELDSSDDITAAIQADKFGPNAAFDRIETALQVIQRERVRLALVEVDGKRVNADGLPYRAFDKWSMRTARLAERAYLELNNISPGDATDFEKGGEFVDPQTIAPPSGEVDADSTTGSSDD